jgi:hypothetical protein
MNNEQGFKNTSTVKMPPFVSKKSRAEGITRVQKSATNGDTIISTTEQVEGNKPVRKEKIGTWFCP